MLEIAANNASDSKLVDGTTQHLSSVNDHRVVLSSVDPTTNSTKSSVDLTIGSKCGDEKQMSHCQTVLSTINDARTDDRQFNNVKSMHSDYFGVEEIACGNNDIPALLTEETSLASQKTEELGKFAQLNRMERMSPRRDDQDLIGSKDVKGGCKIGKRRKRVPWSSEYNRRQKNPRRLPRSEMPHDELLRLREKERKAQQLRRERLKRSEVLKIVRILEAWEMRFVYYGFTLQIFFAVILLIKMYSFFHVCGEELTLFHHMAWFSGMILKLLICWH